MGSEIIESHAQTELDESFENQGISTDRSVEDGSSETPSLPLDQIFEILRNQRRRHVLQILSDSNEQVVIGDLAEQIAAWENEKQVNEINSSERKRVYVGLYQAHLPKMDSMDVINFNKPRGIIEQGPNFNALTEYIDRGNSQESPPWNLYFATLSLLSGSVLIISFLFQSMLTLPIVDITFALVVVAFAACSLANVFWQRRKENPDT